MRSEQEDGLELESEPPVEEPRSWRRNDPDRAEDTEAASAEQLTEPGGGGQPADDEPTEIAEDAGPGYPGGPEQQAVRIEEQP